MGVRMFSPEGISHKKAMTLVWYWQLQGTGWCTASGVTIKTLFKYSTGANGETEVCQTLCGSKSHCIGYAWNPQTQACHLFGESYEELQAQSPELTSAGWGPYGSGCNTAGSNCVLDGVNTNNPKWGQCYKKSSTQVSATGDPHLANLRGEKFDLLQRGKHMLIQVPRFAGPEQTLLRVDADVTGGISCNYSFIKGINITGKWAAEHNKHLTQGFRFIARPQSPPSKRVKAWRHNLGPVHAKVTYGHMPSGLAYLNFHVDGLAELGLPVGGLLGVDGHANVSSKQVCTQDPDYVNMTVEEQIGAGQANTIAM